MKSFAHTDKLTKSDEETFDDKCYTELSDVFNKNDKWILIANELGYQNYVGNWQKSRNPTKVLLSFAEVSKCIVKSFICVNHKTLKYFDPFISFVVFILHRN